VDRLGGAGNSRPAIASSGALTSLRGGSQRMVLRIQSNALTGAINRPILLTPTSPLLIARLPRRDEMVRTVVEIVIIVIVVLFAIRMFMKRGS
jgi:hypothetical protein